MKPKHTLVPNGAMRSAKLITSLQTEIRLYNNSKSISHRTVNKVRPHYKKQSLNAVYFENHRYIQTRYVCKMQRIVVLKQEILAPKRTTDWA
jgi:hypothetical protein